MLKTHKYLFRFYWWEKRKNIIRNKLEYYIFFINDRSFTVFFLRCAFNAMRDVRAPPLSFNGKYCRTNAMEREVLKKQK